MPSLYTPTLTPSKRNRVTFSQHRNIYTIFRVTVSRAFHAVFPTFFLAAVFGGHFHEPVTKTGFSLGDPRWLLYYFFCRPNNPPYRDRPPPGHLLPKKSWGKSRYVIADYDFHRCGSERGECVRPCPNSGKRGCLPRPPRTDILSRAKISPFLLWIWLLWGCFRSGNRASHPRRITNSGKMFFALDLCRRVVMKTLYGG